MAIKQQNQPITNPNPVVYRAAGGTYPVVSAADGTSKPAANSTTIWLTNPGGMAEKARIFITTTGSPTATFTPYVRSGGSSGQVGTLAVQTLNGTPGFDLCFDVQVDGDDLAILATTLSTGTASIYISWR